MEGLQGKQINSDKLLWKGNKKLPEFFESEDVGLMIQQVFLSPDYWKNKGYADWGDFYKWRDSCIIATIYLLGCRPNEACSLRFDDFNFRNMTVKIRGENNKCKKDRVLPVPAALMKFYKPYMKFSRARFWKGSKYLFPSFENDHISASRWKGIFREKVLKPLEIWKAPEKGKVPKYRSYTLRHSRASQLIQKQIKQSGQCDIFMVANYLGHADIRSTMTYLHTDKNYREYMRQFID